MFDDFSKEEKQQVTALLRKTGSTNKQEAIEAQKVLAAELTVPLRQGVLTGDIIGGIFQPVELEPGAHAEFPIDLYRPDNADEFTAYSISSHGAIPHNLVQGDYITVPTFDIGNSIDYLLRYAREARWDIVSRVMEVLEAGFTKKLNDDAWHTIMGAGFGRNIIVSDSNATQGQFTKRLISQMKLAMRRNAGGNSTSMNRGKLTDLYLSPESIEDMRNWGIDQVDEITRREIYVADDGRLSRVFSVNLHDLDELGQGQEYQEFYEDVIVVNGGGNGNGLATSDVELVIGLDLSKNDCFYMPVREQVEMFEDETAHRANMASFYARGNLGFGVLNAVRVLLGSY